MIYVSTKPIYLTAMVLVIFCSALIMKPLLQKDNLNVVAAELQEFVMSNTKSDQDVTLDVNRSFFANTTNDEMREFIFSKFEIIPSENVREIDSNFGECPSPGTLTVFTVSFEANPLVSYELRLLVCLDEFRSKVLRARIFSHTV